MPLAQAFFVIVLSAALAPGQTVVTSPTSNQVLSGSVFALTCSVSSAPSAATAEWIIDGASHGFGPASPCSMPWNSYFVFNGTQHTVHVIVRDSLGATLATSADVTFTTANTYPNGVTLSPSFLSFTVATSTPTTSTWSGTVAVTATVTGTNSGDNKNMCLFIDGIPGGLLGTYCAGGTGTTFTYNVDTSIYSNGPHLLEYIPKDTSGTGSVNLAYGQWGRLVNFSNTTANASVGATGIVWWAIDVIAYKTSATPVLVNKAVNSSVSGSTVACPAVAGGSGHEMAIWIVGSSGAPAVSSVTDTAGNTYTQLSSIANGAGNGWGAWWHSPAIAGNAANVVTAHFSGSVPNAQINCLEYSNITGVDLNGVTTAAATSGAPVSNGFALAQANELVVVGFESDRAITNPVVNPAFTLENAGPGNLSLVADRVVASAASPNELRISPREWSIVPGGAKQLSAAIANADGSTTANANVVWSVENTAICTVNAAGLVTGVGFGACKIIANPGGNLATRSIWGYVQSSNILPHFGTDGAIYSSYTPGKSFWFASAFFAQPLTGFSDPLLSPAKFGALYAQGGFNTWEPSCLGGAGWGSNETAFHSDLASLLTTTLANSQTVTPSLLVHPICTSWAGGSHNTYPSVFGAPVLYATPSWTYAFQQWKNLGLTVGISMADEVNNDWGAPLPHGSIVAAGSCSPDPNVDCFTSITSTGTGTCSVHWTNWSSEGFAIFGASTNSALNSTIGGTILSPARVDGNTFTFPHAACNTAFTADAASDPGMRIEPMIDQWEAGGTDYFHSTGLALLRSLATDVNGYPRMTWPTAAASSSFSNYHFMGDNAISDFGEFYFTTCGFQYTATRFPINCLINDMGIAMRHRWSDMQAPRAWLSQAIGTTLNYGNQGYNVPIASISGNIIAFSAAHGILNITPDITRGWIAGASNAYYNTNWFIDSCPDATHCTISRAAPNTSDAGTYPGALTFVTSGHTLATTSIGAGAGSSKPHSASTPACPNPADIGALFTVSGTGSAYFNANRFWSMVNAFGTQGTPCNAGGPFWFWREAPPAASSSNGGTMTIVIDNGVTLGVQGVTGNSKSGARPMFTSVVEAAVLGAAGVRQYGLGANYSVATNQVWPRFQDTLTTGNQAEMHPYWDNTGAEQVPAFWAASTANYLNQRVAKYLLQPWGVGAPDLGVQFESTLRSGPLGNLLLILNQSDYPQTRVVDLTNCVIAGQPTIRYLADWRGIDVATLNAGVTSDSATLKEGGAAYYVCANNAALEHSPPVIGARLSDVPNATKIVVRYSYQPYLLPRRYDNVVDCGTGTCTLPVERGVGPLYYQLVYLDTNGAILATSDQQTF